MPRLFVAALAGLGALLPPHNIRAVFDESGISEPVDVETFEQCLTVPGYLAATGDGWDDLPAEGSLFFNPQAPVDPSTGQAEYLGAEEEAARKQGKPSYNQIEVLNVNLQRALSEKDAAIAAQAQETTRVLADLTVAQGRIAELEAELSKGSTPATGSVEFGVTPDLMAALVGIKGIGEAKAAEIADALVAHFNGGK